MRDINDYQSKYIKLPYEEIQAKYRQRVVLEQINKHSHKRILEVRCGMDPIFQYIEDFEEMVIVEPSELFVNNAKDIAEKDEKRVRIVCGYLEEKIEQLKNTKYDFIVLSGLLCEVENPYLLLTKVYELCEEGTCVHINTPNAKSLHRLIAKEMRIIDDVYQMSSQSKILQQSSIFDMDSLIELVESVGFAICDGIEYGSYAPKIFTHQQLQNMLEIGVIDMSILDGIFKIGKYLPEYGSEIYMNVIKK